MNNPTKQEVNLTIGKDIIQFGAKVLQQSQEITPGLPPKGIFWYYMKQRYGNKVINPNSIRTIFEKSLGCYYSEMYNNK